MARRYLSRLWLKRTCSFRSAPIDPVRKRQLQPALDALLQQIDLFDRCWVCEDLIESDVKRNGWYRRLIDRYGRQIIRTHFGKHGLRGRPKSLRFALAYVGGDVWNVPVCCEGCHRTATHFYEEEKEWLVEASQWLQKSRDQIVALKKFLRTGDREVLLSLSVESKPAEISLS